MNDYEKLVLDISNKNIAAAQKDEKRNDFHENRFNYINTVISILALILSIISIMMQL